MIKFLQEYKDEQNSVFIIIYKHQLSISKVDVIIICMSLANMHHFSNKPKYLLLKGKEKESGIRELNKKAYVCNHLDWRNTERGKKK